MKNIIIASHYTETPGVMDKFSSYLTKRSYSILYILHPLYPGSSLKSQINFSQNRMQFKLPYFIQYLIEGLITAFKFRTNLQYIRSIDVAFCFDPLSFLNIYLFNNIFKVKKIVYFNVDISYKRFSNPFLNTVYIKLNKFAYNKSTYFLYLSDKIFPLVDPERQKISKAIKISHIAPKIDTENKKSIFNSLIYAGTLTYSTDFEGLFKALEKIKKEGIEFILDIYGDGDRKEKILSYLNKSILKENVKLKGIVDNEKLLKEIMPKYEIGLAPYVIKAKQKTLDHIYNVDNLTTKIVEYISVGLAVITTRLAPEFDIIETQKFGVLIKEEKEWYRVIKALMINKKQLLKYKKNALIYSKKFNEDFVLGRALEKIIYE